MLTTSAPRCSGLHTSPLCNPAPLCTWLSRGTDGFRQSACLTTTVLRQFHPTRCSADSCSMPIQPVVGTASGQTTMLGIYPHNRHTGPWLSHCCKHNHHKKHQRNAAVCAREMPAAEQSSRHHTRTHPGKQLCGVSTGAWLRGRARRLQLSSCRRGSLHKTRTQGQRLQVSQIPQRRTLLSQQQRLNIRNQRSVHACPLPLNSPHN